MTPNSGFAGRRISTVMGPGSGVEIRQVLLVGMQHYRQHAQIGDLEQVGIRIDSSPTAAFFSTIVPSSGETISTRAQSESSRFSSCCRWWIASASDLICSICSGLSEYDNKVHFDLRDRDQVQVDRRFRFAAKVRSEIASLYCFNRLSDFSCSFNLAWASTSSLFFSPRSLLHNTARRWPLET